MTFAPIARASSPGKIKAPTICVSVTGLAMSRKRIKLRAAPKPPIENICHDFRAYIMKGGGMLIADLLKRDPTVKHRCNQIGTHKTIEQILTYLKEFCDLRLTELAQGQPQWNKEQGNGKNTPTL